MNDQLQQLMNNAPAWAREPAMLIGAGVVAALVLLWLLSRLFRARPRADEIVAPVYEEEIPVTRPITPPPVTPPPPPIVEEPLVSPVIAAAPDPVFVAPEPEPEPAPQPEPEPEPGPAPEPNPEPEPVSPYIPEEAPEPAPIAAEPIAAAMPEPAPEPVPVAPEPVTGGTDDLTRMKGVGPRLADRLGSLGISTFAQIAALTPEGADALDARLGDFQGRIHRDRWIEQAGYLAGGDVTGFEETFGKL